MASDEHEEYPSGRIACGDCGLRNSSIIEEVLSRGGAAAPALRSRFGVRFLQKTAESHSQILHLRSTIDDGPCIPIFLASTSPILTKDSKILVCAHPKYRTFVHQ